MQRRKSLALIRHQDGFQCHLCLRAIALHHRHLCITALSIGNKHFANKQVFALSSHHQDRFLQHLRLRLYPAPKEANAIVPNT